jgi:hypothetical protein
MNNRGAIVNRWEGVNVVWVDVLHMQYTYHFQEFYRASVDQDD